MTQASPAPGGRTAWYQKDGEEAAAAFGVDPAKGLSAAQVAEATRKYGPNALPAEKAPPLWRRFLEEYQTYLQIVLVVAALFSFLIREWGTGMLLVVLTVVNAVVGMREQGKAESAMNALKSMMKAQARVRRDGTESQHAGRGARARGRRAPGGRRPGAGRRPHRLTRARCRSTRAP